MNEPIWQNGIIRKNKPATRTPNEPEISKPMGVTGPTACTGPLGFSGPTGCKEGYADCLLI